LSPAAAKPRWVRVLLGLGLAAAVALGVAALLLGGGYALLQTKWAQQRLAAEVVSQAKGALQGRLSLGEVRLSGALHLCIDDLDLRDPEGHPAFAAKSLCVSLEAALLRTKVIHLRSVALVAPVLDLAEVPGDAPGTTTTTLQRALAPRTPPAPKEPAGPFAWSITLDRLDLKDGAVLLRAKPGAAPHLALEGLSLEGGTARYSAQGAAGKLALTGRLATPGGLPAALSLDAVLAGDAAQGALEVRGLRATLGGSALSLTGSLKLPSLVGAAKLDEVLLLPADVAALAGVPAAQSPLAGPLRGSGNASLIRSAKGRQAMLSLTLEGGGGKITFAATATLAQPLGYSGWLALDGVDPGAVVRGAPGGHVSLKLDLEGRGLPRYKDGAPSGDLDALLFLGPARLDGVGKVSARAALALRGEALTVKSLEASALSLSLKAKGAVSPRALALDLDASAGSLAVFARALGALEKKPPLQLTGSGRLKVHVTGSPKSPQAQVHLTSPTLSVGGLTIEELAIDGRLHGPLRAPKGELTLGSRRLRLGSLRLGSPTMKASLDGPLAHLSIDANVRATEASGVAADPTTGRRRGRFSVVGDATIDDDRTGVLLSNLTVAWPEASLALEEKGHLHFHRRETVLDPLRLRGPSGAIALAVTLEHLRGAASSAPPRLEAHVGLEAFDLARAPGFALPRGFKLAGLCDADLGVTGTTAAPDLDGTLELRGLAVQKLEGLDADLNVQFHRGRLRASGAVRGLLGAEAKLKASLPLGANALATAPLELDLSYGPVALATAVRLLGVQAALDAGAAGTLTAKLSARGTLGAPRAAFTADLQGLAWKPLHDGRLDLELAVEKGAARLAAQVGLAGTKAFTLEAKEPFDLAQALRDPAVLGRLFEKPGSARLATAGALDLAVLAKAGLLPAGSAGALTAAAELGGTAAAPTLKLTAAGRALAVERLTGLDFDLRGEANSAFTLGLGLKAGDLALSSLDSSLRVSAAELVALARGGFARAQLDPLLDRPLSLVLSVERLVLGETAKLARAPLDAVGTLSGKVTLQGTANDPRFEGRLLLDGLAVRGHSLGRSDAWVEGDKAGLVAHLGLTPPLAPLPVDRTGGPPGAGPAPAPLEAPVKPAQNGTLLLHANLTAPLSASALLDGGTQALMEGKLDAHLLARRLDLAFVSGVLPGLRRTAGVLDGDVTVEGLLGRPVSRGAAHLAGGLFDVVGQGVFEDVAFDATFAPKEIVLDRLTGSTGGGPFSGILVVGRRKVSADGEEPPLEFTGELHFGDEEAVRDRTGPDGKPLAQRPVPLRQAGEERADFTAEVDLFGEWSSDTGTLTATVKVPQASVHVRALSDKKLPSLTPNPRVLLAAPPGQPRVPAGVDPARAADEEKARRSSRLRADVRFELGKLHVSADDFDFDVTSNLHASWDAQHPSEPSADGTIEVPRGSFSALGRRFEVEHAVITETGGDIADPELEVQARYVNPQATVLVIVTGTAKDPQIDLSSNPAMDQDAIAFFLATGRLQGAATQQGGGVDLSNAATSALGGMLFGELRKQMADVMPVDVLTIEAGGGGRPAQASLGKYFGDRFFVGYRQRLTPTENENTSEGRIEYEIVRGLGAEATVGDENRDVSVLYTKDF
jgi:translocation and assembly module TamB